MKEIQVLSSGCAECIKTAELIQSIAAECNIPVNVVKESNPEVIMSYGVMRTPAIVVENILMHSGSIPNREKIEGWLK